MQSQGLSSLPLPTIYRGKPSVMFFQCMLSHLAQKQSMCGLHTAAKETLKSHSDYFLIYFQSVSSV